METLPRPPDTPHFWTFDCDRCGQPSDQWDWNPYFPRPEKDYDAPVLCTTCAAELLAPPELRDALRQSMQSSNRQVRQHGGLQDGTLIVCREEFENRNPRGRQRYPGLLYGVVVDSWDDVWPEGEWIEWPDGGVLLFLGGFVLAGLDRKGRDIPAGWLILRSLERPADEPLSISLPADFSPTDDERKLWEQARGAFLKLPERRGRRSGSGRFETAEDLEAAVFAAVAALCKRRRKITQKAVGSDLIAKCGRNATTGQRAGDSPKGPDRQFRDWCTRFKRDPRDLIARAIVACASGE